MEKRPLLLCTDPGIDDFIALSMVLARPEFDVLGMIALSGNVGLDVTVNNALLACELNGRSDIPVLAGSAKPLARPARSASNIHGKSGLGKSTELYAKGSPACLKRRRFHFANGGKIHRDARNSLAGTADGCCAGASKIAGGCKKDCARRRHGRRHPRGQRDKIR